MKKLLFLWALLIFACSSDDGGTIESDEFNRTYVGQFEILNRGATNMTDPNNPYDWCLATTGEIIISHRKEVIFDDPCFSADFVMDVAPLTYNGNSYVWFDFDYYDILECDDEIENNFLRIYGGKLMEPWDTTRISFFLDCTFDGNTINGIIKESLYLSESQQVYGTFTATLQ